MKDPTLPVQSAIAAAVVTRLTSEGYSSASDRVIIDPEPDQALPYVTVGQSTVIPHRTHTNDGAECTHTFVAWAATPVESAQVADYALQAVTDRAAPLSVTGFDSGLIILDFRGSPIREEAPGTASGWYWGTPVRIRLKLLEQ